MVLDATCDQRPEYGIYGVYNVSSSLFLQNFTFFVYIFYVTKVFLKETLMFFCGMFLCRLGLF